MRISDWSSDVCSSDLKTCALTDAGIGNGHVARLGAANHDIYFGDRNVERSWIAGIERASANTGVKLSSEVLRLFFASSRYRHRNIGWGMEMRDPVPRSVERRDGKEGGSTGRYRWSPCH